MKEDFNHIEKEVKKALMKYKWEFLSSEYNKDNFGNWIIEFKNSSFKLRLVNDRGDILTQVYDGKEWQLGEHYFKNLKIETVSNYLEDDDNQVQNDIFQYLSQILMHLNALQPINYEEEIKRGKIPLFLERHEIEFLCNEWRKIPVDRLTKEQREIWAKIAYKGHASLHKKGMYFEPTFPTESEKYK